MDATELRIGNLIYSELYSKNTDYTIVNIDFFGLSGYVKFWGIPLTEEWLLKFGFEKCEISEEQGYQKGVYKIFINSLGEVNFCFFNFGDWYKHIEYVHQLQNLYFAITGEELEFSSVAQHVEP